ncbi:transposase [Paenibacillus sophorae]|nr:transposase [Paenibacillus sophorae]
MVSFGDTAHSEKDNLAYSERNEIELVSKLNPLITQGNRKKEDEFEFNKDAGMYVCKAGHLATRRARQGKKGKGKNQVDCYICPNNEVLKYSTTNREGYREYKSNPDKCKDCPYLSHCTESKNHIKLVVRHVWEEYIEKAEDIRHTTGSKELYALRSQTIERVFADAKELHGMRYAKHRGLARVKMELNFLFACMNLKKLANRLWKNGLTPSLLQLFSLILEI